MAFFVAHNVAEGLEDSACRLFCKLYNAPLSEGKIQNIVKWARREPLGETRPGVLVSKPQG